MEWPRLDIGAFVLEKTELGRGAMGTVLLGRHRASGLSVAIKVLIAARARDETFRASFEAEVRALAGLTHPSVLAVLDHGTIDAGAAEQSAGHLIEGSPYLVMELASGGSLRDQADGALADWASVRRVLAAMLQGLAHAHSRGVIHRDLKLGNVLLCSQDDPRPGPKVADFGLAQLLEDVEGSSNTVAAAGTPAYMAPEQFQGHFRDFGPWTDLYAVGCMAFELVCGRRPFDGTNSWQVGWAHLSGRRGPFEPRMACPPGLEAWIDALIELRAEDRFQRAADALWALDGLGPTAGSVRGGASVDRDAPPTAATLIEGGAQPPEWLGLPEPSTDAPRLHMLPAHPTIDELLEPQLPSRSLRGVGLGLIGLRRLPLVGRRDLRHRLWELLRGVRVSGEPQMVLLTGGPGVGKSRLAEWLAERSHEVGIATVLIARHGPGGGPNLGLTRMVARHLQVVGLSGAALRERLATHLHRLGIEDGMVLAAFEAFLAPEMTATASGPAPVGATPQEVFAALRQVLRAEVLRRPLLLLLDDVGWSLETLEFARYLRDSPAHRTGPTLLVLTSRTGQETGGAAARRAFNALQDRDLESIEVLPLTEPEGVELTEVTLGLAPALAGTVRARSEGRPLFVLELVTSWAAQGLIALSEHGLEASADDLPVPDSLHALWQSRIRAALPDPESQRALECAAVLGREADVTEWRALCEMQGLSVGAPLLAAAADAHLLEERERRLMFTHPLLRESLERSAGDGGRLMELHRHCAHIVGPTAGRIRGASRRVAFHLLEAGDLAEALEPAEAAAREALALADFAAVEELLEGWSRALDGLDPSRTAQARIRRDIVYANVLVTRDRPAEAEALAVSVADRARELHMPVAEAEALRHAGTAAMKGGDVSTWQSRLAAALAAAERGGDLLEQARSTRGLGLAAMSQGLLGEARTLFGKARHLFDQLGDERGRADCRLALAQLGRAEGNPAAARDARIALDLFEHLGCRYAAASTRNTLGELLRADGRIDEARAMYQRAEAALTELGASDALAPRLNLASLLVGDGNIGEAVEAYSAIAEEAIQRGRPVLEAFGRSLALPWTALASPESEMVQQLTRLEELLSGSGLRDPELADALRRAASELTGRGFDELAARATGLAVRHGLSQ